MKRISVVIVLLIVVFAIVTVFYLYPWELEKILNIQQDKIYQLKIDYDLLTLSNGNEDNLPIVIDDKDEIIKIINIFRNYKYLKKFFITEPKPKSSSYEKIHLHIFHDAPINVDMLTINEQCEIIIYTAQKGTRTYKITGNKKKLFDEIKSLFGLASLSEQL